MNWGRGMLLVYVGFVGVMLFMVVKSFSNDQQLVTEDYYAEELQFQNRIDATGNALPYADSVQFNVENGNLQLSFPQTLHALKDGQLYFYRASDAKKDIKIPIQLDGSGLQTIQSGALDKGYYTVKMNWILNGKEYYMERNIFI